MVFLFDIFVLFLCVSLLFVKGRSTKIAILITNSLLFSQVPVPGSDSNFFLVSFYLLSELKNVNRIINQIKGTIAFYSFLVLCVFAVYSIVISPHVYQSFGSLISFVKSSVVSNYLVIIISFISIQTRADYKKVIKLCFVPICILFVIAVLNYVTHQSIYLGLIDENTTDLYSYAERYRVQATFSLGCTYGFYNIFIFLFYLYAVIENIGSRKVNICVLMMSVTGVFLSGFRTCILALIAALIVYVLYALNIKKGFKIILISAIIAIPSYICVPFVQNTTDYVFSVFEDSDEQEASSSSLDMRKIQLAAVWRHTKDVPLTGNGVGYFLIDMGWGKGRRYLIDKELQGLESIFFSYLLERGIIGVALYVIFILLVFIYFWRNRDANRIAAGFGASIMCAYVLFSVATGEQGSFLPTAILLGLFMRLLHESKAQYVR